MVENKYGWNHAPNGVWHPVGTWYALSLEEYAKLRKGERKSYDRQKHSYEWNQHHYDELVTEYKQDRMKWFRVSYRHEIQFNPTASVCINDVWFQTPFTKKNMDQFYQFPKGPEVAEVLYRCPDSKSMPHGFCDSDWVWKAQFSMRNGILYVADLRALTKSVDRIITGFEWEWKQEVYNAIAAESPNGTYLVRIKDFGYHHSKDTEDGEYLLIKYEVMSGQARGYQGALFFDEKSQWSQKKLSEIEYAIDAPEGIWKQISRNTSGIGITGPRKLQTRCFKAYLDFSGEKVKLDSPRKVAESEINLWV